MTDFLIVYELEQRELENITLLGAELERRGYSVCFEKFMYLNPVSLRKKYKNKVRVIIIHSTYNDTVIYNLVYSAVGCTSKIVNLQWEQVGTIADENSTTAPRYPKQSAVTVPHICWGFKMQEILVKCGMDVQRAPVTGPIHMDFLRKEFDGYYMPKEEIYKEFGIPDNKKVMLFISSFSYTSLTEKQIKVLLRMLSKESVEAFRTVSIESQKEILKWIEKYLNENEDAIFIYRPHPAEKGNQLLAEYEKRNPRLYVTNKYSVKQWIKTVDVIFNWFSTSMAEVYFAGKDAFVLRPVKIEPERDVAIMRDCRFIENYEDFVSAANGCNDLVASTDALMAYYDVTDIPSYVRCADFLEDVINTDKYDYVWTESLKRDFKKRYTKYLFVQMCLSVRKFMRYILHNIRKICRMPYNSEMADVYRLNRELIAEHKRKQQEKLEIMKSIISKQK